MVSKTTVLLIAVAFSVGFALMWWDNPLKSWLQPKITPVATWIKGAVAGLIAEVKANPKTAATVGVPVALGLFGLFSKAYSNMKAKAAAEVEAKESQALQAEASELAIQRRLDEAENKLEIYELEGGAATKAIATIEDLRVENKKLQDQYYTLRTSYETLQREHDKIVRMFDPTYDPLAKKPVQ